jgi:hypothetical protein
LEFLVSFEEGASVWVLQSDLQQRAPRALCDYLLNRVSFSANKK